MKKYADSMEKAVEWLIKRQKDDGSLHPGERGISIYYKAPFALGCRGRNLEALKLLNWIRKNELTEDGDFSGPNPRGIHENIYPYSNSWLTVAANKLGQFDISNKGIEFLLKLQDSNTGGFFAELNDRNSSEDEEEMNKSTYKNQEKIKTEGDIKVWAPGLSSEADKYVDTMCTAMAGLACIQTGKIEEAKLAAGLFEKVYEEQPDPDNIFYFVYHTEKGLVTDFPAKNSSDYSINTDSTKQHYFHLGIATAFLTSLSMATGNQNYLELAQKYINYINRCASDRFTTPQSGKIGWGAAYLALVTGKEEYKKMALKVGDYLVDSQEEEGHWHDLGPDEDISVTVDVTSEFVILLNEIMRALV